MHIVLFIILLPVLIGYLWGASLFFKDKVITLMYQLSYSLRKIRDISLLPKLIQNEIRVRRYIIRSNRYFNERLPELKRKGFNHHSQEDEATWALAERLTHTKHESDYFLHFGTKKVERPPFVLRWIIAQVIR